VGYLRFFWGSMGTAIMYDSTNLIPGKSRRHIPGRQFSTFPLFDRIV
jgi:hypothetical protein